MAIEPLSGIMGAVIRGPRGPALGSSVPPEDPRIGGGVQAMRKEGPLARGPEQRKPPKAWGGDTDKWGREGSGHTYRALGHTD